MPKAKADGRRCRKPELVTPASGRTAAPPITDAAKQVLVAQVRVLEVARWVAHHWRTGGNRDVFSLRSNLSELVAAQESLEVSQAVVRSQK